MITFARYSSCALTAGSIFLCCYYIILIFNILYLCFPHNPLHLATNIYHPPVTCWFPYYPLFLRNNPICLTCYSVQNILYLLLSTLCTQDSLLALHDSFYLLLCNIMPSTCYSTQNSFYLLLCTQDYLLAALYTELSTCCFVHGTLHLLLCIQDSLPAVHDSF